MRMPSPGKNGKLATQNCGFVAWESQMCDRLLLRRDDVLFLSCMFRIKNGLNLETLSWFISLHYVSPWLLARADQCKHIMIMQKLCLKTFPQLSQCCKDFSIKTPCVHFKSLQTFMLCHFGTMFRSGWPSGWLKETWMFLLEKHMPVLNEPGNHRKWFSTWLCLQSYCVYVFSFFNPTGIDAEKGSHYQRLCSLRVISIENSRCLQARRLQAAAHSKQLVRQ